MFNPVAPYRYRLPNLYLSVADPDLLACGSGTWISLDIACFYEEHCQPSNRVGLPLHNILSSGVLMKSIGVEFLQLDALPGINHMRGMQYQIVLNIAFCPELSQYNSYTKLMQPSIIMTTKVSIIMTLHTKAIIHPKLEWDGTHENNKLNNT